MFTSIVYTPKLNYKRVTEPTVAVPLSGRNSWVRILVCGCKVTFYALGTKIVLSVTGSASSPGLFKSLDGILAALIAMHYSRQQYFFTLADF